MTLYFLEVNFHLISQHSMRTTNIYPAEDSYILDRIASSVSLPKIQDSKKFEPSRFGVWHVRV